MGERFYIEQQERARWDAQLAHQQSVLQAARMMQSQANSTAHASQLGLAEKLKYAEETVSVGTLDLQSNENLEFDLPVDLSGALNLIASVSGTYDHGPGTYLWWYVSTGFDGEMLKLRTPEDDGSRLIKRDSGAALIRLYGPFTKRVTVSFFSRLTNQFNDTKVSSTWTDVTLKLAYQTA